MMNEAHRIITRMKEINQFIDNAQTSLKNGRVINLSHLDDEVGQLCEQTLSLPPVEAKAVQPVMAELIGKLENLSLSLQSFQEKLRTKQD